MGQPGDGVGLAAAGRVLDQIALARPVLGRIGQEPPHHVELVVAGEDLLSFLPARLFVLLFDDLGIVFQDIGQALRGEDPLPQVVGLEPIGVGRVARPVVPALVEGQEPGALALEVGAHAHLLVVDGKMHDAAAELEEQLPRVAVAAVLLDGVLHRLLGQVVLQLKGGDGQAVDEQAQVQGAPRLVAAVAQLAGDAEAVGGKALGGLDVARRGRAVEQVQRVRAVLDARCAARR